MATLKQPLREESSPSLNSDSSSDAKQQRTESDTELKRRPTMQERLDRQSREAAEGAIKRYNIIKGVNYKVDVPVNSNGFSCMGKDVIHVNFTAKNIDDDPAAPSKLFFAEIQYNRKWREMGFSDCAIVDPTETDPSKMVKGCSYCSSAFATPILHAVGNYKFGKYEKYYYVHLDSELWEDEE